MKALGLFDILDIADPALRTFVTAQLAAGHPVVDHPGPQAVVYGAPTN